MPEIMTAQEAAKKARGFLEALKEMPQNSPDRKGYEESLSELLAVKEYGLKETLEKELREAGFLTQEVEEVHDGTETEELVLPSEGKPKDESRSIVWKRENRENRENREKGDDRNMQTYVAKAKTFLNTHLFGGVRVSHVVALVLGAILVWAVMPSGDNTEELDQQIKTLTGQRDFAQTGWGTANTTINSMNDTINQLRADAGADVDCNCSSETAKLQEKLDECQNETGVSAEVGSFDDEQMKDWIAGSLKLQKTTIGEFELFESTDEALEFITEVYAWNDAHNLKWNLDELSYAIADEHKTDDPAKAMFFSSKAVYIVLPSEDNIVIPEFYELDENDGEFEFNKVSPSSVGVIAMDKLKESKNND